MAKPNRCYIFILFLCMTESHDGAIIKLELPSQAHKY